MPEMNRRKFLGWIGAATLTAAVPFVPQCSPLLDVEWKAGMEWISVFDPRLQNCVAVGIPAIEYSIKLPLTGKLVELTRQMLGRVNLKLIGPIVENVHYPETLLFTGLYWSRFDKRATLRFVSRTVAAIDQDEPGGWNHLWNSERGGFCRAVPVIKEILYKTDRIERLLYA